ncbi:translational GTPase TypA [Desulfovibrio subterraneus]|uniref:Large ribosomal subunit assembly factor BipA n=1 Tax=Desulfovibrio subterraneus TaxID=2718620 RepID=A0A7J0BID6_9BACT|nr:translational GTPase TypA [Desulfovibrio subterraneus]WBF67605.1 translational GTPase TypA [Desulfovibrio subterraneus]GFM33436.1 GTP-binding protein [Desulfovibrio subterraneus]
MKNIITNDSVRNVAIIAHVDHGKTTLVDAMFRQGGIYRDNQEVSDRVMDSMDLERERGITIAAKNCAVRWGDRKINIIDTPGHADFGGEVERSLSMANGAILLVDSSEGPLPQTRFVLKKTLEAGLKVIVVVNKIDRKDARADEVLNEIYDLFIDLDANDAQLEFPVLYAIGREGVAMRNIDDPRENLTPLFETIVEQVPGPAHDPEEPFQMLVADLSYSEYLGRLAVGRVFHGKAHNNDALACIGADGTAKSLKVSKLQTYDGLQLRETKEAEPGDIVVISGIEDVVIGDTICTRDKPRALKRINVDEPTVSMRFSINTSPLVGQEGKLVQSSKIRERLQKEMLRNVAIRVEDSEERDSFIVKGRGEFQMAIIVEQMRREGFELTVGRPEVIYREVDGKTHEPIEQLFIDCDESFLGIVTEKLSVRKGRMNNLINHGTGRIRMEFSVPSRGLIGYRDEFLTDTKGTGIMNSLFAGYEPHRGEFPTRFTGSLVADRAGAAVAYALFNLEPRGELFVVPGEPIYEGMIVGEHNRDNDIDVNPAKGKKLTNMRASGKDEAVTLTPVRPMTLERAIHFVREDELVEVTPQSIRLRKSVLSAMERHRIFGKKKKETM